MDAFYKFAKLATILLSVYWITDAMNSWKIQMYSADILHGLDRLDDMHLTTKTE